MENLKKLEEGIAKIMTNLGDILHTIHPAMIFRLAWKEYTEKMGREELELEIEQEPVTKATRKDIEPRVQALKDYRLKVGISAQKASQTLGKGNTFIGRLENGFIKHLDTPTEKKILELYKQLEEAK